MTLSPSERSTWLAVATAALPVSRRLPGADVTTVEAALGGLAPLGEAALAGLRGMLASLNALSIATRGAPFAAQPAGVRVRLLQSWGGTSATRNLLRGLLAPLKLAYFGSEEVHARLGLRHTVPTPATPEPARWRGQIVAGASLAPGATLECDVVVVGSGAGGAPVAYELARAGLGVILVEEGHHFTRVDFNGRPVEMLQKLYRNASVTATVGNCFIPLPLGRTVGGTTTINSGTCLRPTDDVMRSWQTEFGLDSISPDAMAPWFERVENMLGVEPGTPEAIGATGRIIARGCDALGYAHRPLTRNAPGCDGQGLCCFGCPTDAKRSTNISYVPAALQRGAQLITGARVTEVLLQDETAVGVQAEVLGPEGAHATVQVRAKAVVLACGTVHTPHLLLSQGIANASGELGRNLSIHPAGHCCAVMDERVDPTRSIPQGYSIDEFHAEGLMFEGGTLPMEMFAATFPGLGPSFMALMDDFDRLCSFGFMIKDTSRGRVHRGPGGRPIISYRLNSVDVASLTRGMEILSRVFLSAGARRVHPGVAGAAPIRSIGDAAALGRRRFAARDFDLSAYHPLGTARMGSDPLRSVVDATHETHDVHNLYICDGSVIPGSLGVNPQITIMALATRAAQFIARRIERLDSKRAPAGRPQSHAA